MWPFSNNQEVPPAPARLEPVLNQQSADSALVKSGDFRVLDIFGMGNMAGGVVVNEKTAMQLSAVHGCVRVITSALSILPLHLYREGDDGRERDNAHPLRRLLNLQPNPRFTSSAFRKYVGKSNLLRGDGFAEILRGRGNSVAGFLPHHPDDVLVERQGERLQYYVFDQGKARGVQQEDMIHVPGLGFNGVRSESVVTHYARNAVGGALAADRHASKFFESGTMQRFGIEQKGKMSPEGIEALRNQWVDTYGGSNNSNKPLLLTEGAQIKELSLSATDAQLLETRAFNVEDICRFFGVPPHMVGHTQKSTSWGTGIEQQSIGFVVYCLQPYLTDFEQELNRKLFPNEDRFFEFETGGLLRGDSKAQSEAFRASLGGSNGPGWQTVNEIRKLKNLKPIPGGDVLVTWNGPAGPNTEPNEEPVEEVPAEPKQEPAEDE